MKLFLYITTKSVLSAILRPARLRNLPASSSANARSVRIFPKQTVQFLCGHMAAVRAMCYATVPHMPRVSPVHLCKQTARPQLAAGKRTTPRRHAFLCTSCRRWRRFPPRCDLGNVRLLVHDGRNGLNRCIYFRRAQ